MFYATNKPHKHAKEELSRMLQSLSIGQTVTIATKEEQVTGPISLIHDIQKEPISL